MCHWVEKNPKILSTHVFNILGDEMKCTHKGLPFHCELSRLSQKKHLGGWDANWISHIFHGTPFLLERLTDEQTQSYSESTFWQIFVWEKKALLFIIVFVTSWKPAKMKISGILILPLWPWEFSSCHTIFLMTLAVLLRNVIIFLIVF